MNWQFGAQPIYVGFFGLNVTAFFVAAAVFVIGAFLKVRRRQTSLLGLSVLLFLVSFTYMTLHGRLLQYVFPFSLPEQPLIDNNLTLNYFATSALTFAILPLLTILILNKAVSVEEIGLKVGNARKTAIYTVFGTIFAASIFLVTDHFFHQQWISGYTLDGLIMWVALVGVAAVFLQTFFYCGIMFNMSERKENSVLLGIIAVLAFLSMVAPNSLPWLVCSILTFSTRLFITWKTKNVYGAAMMAITVGLIEILSQIL